MSRIAVITGATGGLGQSVVKRFLQAEYQVIAVDVREDGENWLESLGRPAGLNYRRLSVTEHQAVQVFEAELTGLDVLVNLVGGFAWSSFEDTSPETLERMLNLNLRSTFSMTQGLLALLKQAEHGRVINVGARQALLGGPMVTAYALSKAAVVNFTESLAAELKDSNVTVNAVVPSTIDTPINRRDMPDADFDKWVKPEDLAEVIHFLASPAARAVSGAIIPVYHKA